MDKAEIDSMQSDSVAVVIPVFNRTQLCLTALESVYNQTVQPAQVIVVDDGSTESSDPLREYLNHRNGLYLRQENRGVAAARNLGAAYALTKWVAFLDSDDTWHSDKLEKQLRLHRSNPEIVISQTRERWLRNGKEIIQKSWQTPASGDCFERSLALCCISASAVMIRKETFVNLGGFDPEFTVCEDYDLWVRITALFPVGLVDEALVTKNRGRSDQLSESVKAPDRFRLRSLLKLLNQPCPTAQRELIVRELVNRLAILEKGAIKRGLEDDLCYYREIREQYVGE